MRGFVKLDAGIRLSSLWVERDLRSVFLTALVMAEPFETEEPLPTIKVNSLESAEWVVPPGWYGLVRASGTAIVRADGCDLDTGLAMLEKLASPDPDSRSTDFDGRRMVRVDGGYLILNYMKYRDRDYTAADRMRRLRERKATRSKVAEVTDNSDAVTRNVTHAEAEGREQSTETTSSATAEPEQTDVRMRQVLSVLGTPGDLLVAWEGLLLGMRQGLGAPGMKPLPWDTLLEAAQELAAVGGAVTPTRYKAFVGKVLNRRDREADGGPQYSTRGGQSRKKGYTLEASKLIQKVRTLRNPQYPTSLVPDWRAKLDEQQMGLGGFVYDFGMGRFLAETKDDGTLTAQLAKAMEEAQL